MQIVVIHDWPQADPAIVQKVAEIMGILPFEAQQRMGGGGPVVIAQFADPGAAESLRSELERAQVPTLLLDPAELRSGPQPVTARKFFLAETYFRVGMADGSLLEIPYADMSHLLPATQTLAQAQAGETVTEKKFSLGKTLLAGGVPMRKKVTSRTEGTAEVRDEVLCLVIAGQRQVLLSRSGLDYAGLGDKMQLSRELNFNLLKTELRQRAPQLVFDSRLLKKAGIVRLLGGAFAPEANLDLAFSILAQTLS